MKKILHIFFIIIFFIIIIGLVVPYFLPKNIEVEKVKSFKAPISQVFQEFNDLENYSTWAPWITEDSINTKVNYFAPYKGKGSSLTWVNKKDSDIGKGDYKILESNINKYIKSQIIFDNKFMCEGNIQFVPQNEGTQVTIKLKTDKFSYFNRIFSYLYTSEIEDILDKSLDKLGQKLSGESGMYDNLAIGEADYINTENIKLLAIRNETSTDPLNIYKSMNKSMADITQYLIDSLRYIPSDIKNPIAYYTKFDTIAKVAVIYIGYPVKTNELHPTGNIQVITIPKGKAIFTPIKGKLQDVRKVRYVLDKYAEENGIKFKEEYWEEFNNYPLISEDEFTGKAYHLIKE